LLKLISMMIEVIVGFGRIKIADVYHIGYVTFMNYISVPSINAKIDEAIAKRESLNTKFKY